VVYSTVVTEIADIAESFRRHLPGIIVRVGSRGVFIPSDNPEGFPVAIEIIGIRFLVYLGTGYVEFGCIDEAVNCALWACSSRSRLMVLKCGVVVNSWRFEVSSLSGVFSAHYWGVGPRYQESRDAKCLIYRNAREFLVGTIDSTSVHVIH
jgi:hypothetical protein